MADPNPNKRPRQGSELELLKPPVAHMESYRLIRNLKTKKYKAELHVDTLKKCLASGNPPSRLYPRMRPFIPTNDVTLMLEWESLCLNFAKSLTKLLATYWENRIPTIQREIDQIDTQIKLYASTENYQLIHRLSDQIVEKHRTNPNPTLRRSATPTSKIQDAKKSEIPSREGTPPTTNVHPTTN